MNRGQQLKKDLLLVVIHLFVCVETGDFMKNSNFTGRAHRTMQSAFGPYTSHDIYEETEGGWLWPVVSFAATLALVLILF